MEFEVNIRNQFLRASEFFSHSNIDNRGEKVDPLFNRLTMTENRLNNPALFIDSMIRNIPTQSLYIDGSVRQWICIDGNKRLNAIKDFYNNVFPLNEDIHNRNISGKYYNEIIDTYFAIRFNDYQLRANILNPTDKASKEEISKRLKLK